MKIVFQKRPVKGFLFTIILPIAILRVNTEQAQGCPPPITTTVTSYFNTCYPGQQATVSAGSTSIAPANTGEIVTGPVMTFPAICLVLPIQFLEVNAKRNEAQVLINWEVTNEKEITNYIIERSYNGYDFFTAGIVGNKPASGYLSRYTFSDASAGDKVTTCYRIIAQDADGQKIISKVITIQTVLEEEVLNISPVPATSYSTITWASAGNIKLDITLFDVAAHAVLSRRYPLKKGVNELLLTNLETLPAGLYFVEAFDGAHHRNGKLIIHHTF
jgi:hypothetical protein